MRGYTLPSDTPIRRVRQVWSRSWTHQIAPDMQVIATAGHTDHGKSTLVRALTGMDPGHGELERRPRPGHRPGPGLADPALGRAARLRRRAGPRACSSRTCSPGWARSPRCCSWWPPTRAGSRSRRSTSRSLDALGIRRGLLVVTRIDLADPGPAAVRGGALIAATSLGEVEALAVSAVTGEGLPGLVDALARLAGSLPAPDPGAPVRIWVDQVSCSGDAATVLVTGTLPPGPCAAGTSWSSLRPCGRCGSRASRPWASR